MFLEGASGDFSGGTAGGIPRKFYGIIGPHESPTEFLREFGRLLMKQLRSKYLNESLEKSVKLSMKE